MLKLLLSLFFIACLTAAGLYFTRSDSGLNSTESNMLQLGDFAYQEKRYEDAFTWYQNAAFQGIAEGQMRLSELYQLGQGTEKDEVLAIHWLEKSAAQGLAQAQYEYAEALEFGRGINRAEMSTTASWYQKAAAQNYPKAMLRLAKLYINGSGIEKNGYKALTWVIKAENSHIPDAQALHQEIIQKITSAADSDDEASQYLMAIMYRDGMGIEKDSDKSMFWLRKAAQKENPDAEYTLAQTLVQAEQWDEGMSWLNKAAQHGHARAGYDLAALLATTPDTQITNNIAWRWLYHGLRNGSPQALYNLAIALKAGLLDLPQTDYHYETWLDQAARGNLVYAQNDLAVHLKIHSNDTAKCIQWLNRAALSDEKAQFNLGLIYARGDGITPNDDLAIRWWTEAEKNGNSRAKLMLGLLHNLGRGVGRSEKEAVSWYLKAAEDGNVNAIYNLAVLFYNGIGIEQDYVKAAKYFKTLSEQGDSEAQNTYASMLLEGQGVPRSAKESAIWFERAATNKNIKAMFNLASLYRSGAGFSQDDKKALFWYMQAANLDFAPAQNALGYMYAEGRGTDVDTDKAEMWLQKASDNGLAIANNNFSALSKKASFTLIHTQIDTNIRDDILTDKKLDLSLWLEIHQQPVLL